MWRWSTVWPATVPELNPTLKPSLEISCDRMEARETSVSGAKYFLSRSLKSETTAWTSLRLACETWMGGGVLWEGQR